MSAGADGAPPDWAALPTAALAAWVRRQRWSGAHGAALSAVRIAAVVPVPLATGAHAALLFVDAALAGRPVRWQLPLATVLADDLDANDGDASVCIADVSHPDGRLRAICDATHVAAFRDALRDALAGGATWSGRAADGTAVEWRAYPIAGHGDVLRTARDSRVGSAEQSNTSILYGDAAIVKLFRRLEPGPQPDVAIGAALGHAGFAHVPTLLGVAELHAEGAVAVSGMAQRLVPGARDAWAVMVDAAQTELAADGVPASTTTLAHRLGVVTRALHDALAVVDDAAFGVEPAGRVDVQRWAGAAAEALDAALDAALAAALDAAPAVNPLDGLRARRDALRAQLDGLAATVGEDAGARIRHHGDYHLGQVLVGADGGFAIIDFEGEPERPLSARLARQSPLRDVAGMLRSFGYVAAVASADVGGTPAGMAAAAEWEVRVRTRFLDGYLARSDVPPADRPAYLPADRAHVDALLQIFELEKLFYELRYEVRNRPHWLPIPLRGLTALLATIDGAEAATATLPAPLPAPLPGAH